MARPKLDKYMTSSVVARSLDLSNSRLIYWIDHAILPQPSKIDENGVRYFSQEWLADARLVMEQRNKQ